MKSCTTLALGVMSFLLIAGMTGSSSAAPLVAPTFSALFTDAVTNDNQFVNSEGKHAWNIDIGADSYQNEFYERPTIQGKKTAGEYSATQYFANLDIETARAGRDAQYLFIEINLVGNYFQVENKSPDIEGLKYEYGFRFSNDPDGRYGYLMRGEFANPFSQAAWTPLKTFGHKDTNGDVGGSDIGGTTGLSVTQSDNSKELGNLNGYDSDIISDGKYNGTEVLFIRMLDSNTVQFALDYVALGLSASYIDNIRYLDMQAIKGGPKDPRNYFWNDKYLFSQAGSPYPGDGVSAPQNIYELDTIRGGYVPEPATLGFLALGGLAMLRRRR